MKVNFVKPDLNESDFATVLSVLRSGWITTGKVSKEFEEELSKYLDTKKTILMSSQTMAQEMILRLLGIGPGDEVIVPAYTYTASCSVIYHVGAKPILIDSQKDSLEMDYDLMAMAINKKTKAIIPVDLAGIPCDYQKIREVLEAKKDLYQANNLYQSIFDRVPILADAAHSLGASYQSEMIGNLADFTSFSFHAVKNLTTGEGGAVTWRSLGEELDEKIYRDLNVMSLHGQTKDALDKFNLGQWEYDVVQPLYKCNLTDIAAALGLSQLKRYPETLARRAQIITKYNQALHKFNVHLLKHKGIDYESSYHLYIVRLLGFTEEKRNLFIEKMAEKGVSCNVHYKPLPMLTAYKDQGFTIGDFPRSFDHYQNSISLPLYANLSQEETDYVISSFIATLEEF